MGNELGLALVQLDVSGAMISTCFTYSSIESYSWKNYYNIIWWPAMCLSMPDSRICIIYGFISIVLSFTNLNCKWNYFPYVLIIPGALTSNYLFDLFLEKRDLEFLLQMMSWSRRSIISKISSCSHFFFSSFRKLR